MSAQRGRSEGRRGRIENYWPYYCEENVWHLCADERLRGRRAEVVITTNPTRSVAVWSQRTACSPADPVIWDYHVVLVAEAGPGFEVWDLDCTSGCPLAVDEYLSLAFPLGDEIGPEHSPLFRILPADQYRSELRTDRSHMRDPRGGWASPPPPWPPISEDINLIDWIDLERDGPGEVCDLDGLRVRFRA